MYDYFHAKLPLCFETMFTFLAEPNQTKNFKKEKVKKKWNLFEQLFFQRFEIQLILNIRS